MILRRLATPTMILLGCLGTVGSTQAGLPTGAASGKTLGRRRTRPADSISRSIRFSRHCSGDRRTNPRCKRGSTGSFTMEHKRLEAIARGEDPGGAARACTFGYPAIMLDSPLMFEVLPTPKETTLIFSSREIRHVYTDGRQHTPKDELWATPWGDSIGHWEGQTLVIDTIAVKSAFGSSESEGVSVVAFGDVEGEQTITMLSPQAHFIERIRMPDKDHLEDQMTVIDPTNLTAPWHMNRTYQRVAHIHRMVYEDCEGEERNPIVNGHFTLAPPPGPAKSRQ